MESPRAMTSQRKDSYPLAVDLDGTLIRTDVLIEGVVALLKRKPWMILFIPILLVRGKAAFKNSVASMTALNVDLLPYDEDLLKDLQKEKEGGRKLYLVTAATQSIADAVHNKLGIFDEAFGSSSNVNLSGIEKARFLCNKFGAQGFEYIGDSYKDLEVWRVAAGGWAVRITPSVRKQLPASVKVHSTYSRNLRDWARALRLHQWSKNLLIFVPLILGYYLVGRKEVEHAIIAFLSFSLLASCIYLVNDVVDVEADRGHPRKKFRPFASGHLPLHYAAVVAPLLLIGSILIALPLPQSFLGILSAYFLLNLSYSLFLKRLLIVDVILLAALYTARIFAGGIATGIPISEWLLAFSTFFFVGLAFIKRYSEMRLIGEQGKVSESGRGYETADENLIAIMGIVSGYLSVLVFALYIDSDKVKETYTHPTWLWLICPLLMYWISLLWMKARRVHVSSDTIVFASKERATYIVSVLIAILLILAK